MRKIKKHTPGPWEVKKYETRTSVVGADGTKVLSITNQYFKGETEANARLIAAAPDLLEELENIIFHLYDSVYWYDFEKTKQIISKATGQDEPNIVEKMDEDAGIKVGEM